jgi:CRP/FNR family cyclic AMP-dependent transcriptional regulator
MPLSIPTLQRLRLLDQLPAEELARFGRSMVEKQLERRQVVLRPGEHPAGLGFLIEGRLQTVSFTLDGKEVGTEFIDAGDFFGEVPLIDGQPAADYIIAIAPSRIVFLDREEAHRLMFATPEGARAIAERLADRLRRASSYRSLLALPSSFQRVCAQLSMLARPSKPGTGAVIIQPPTHQEIAIMVNTSRETVTRTLQFLLAMNVLTRDGQDLVVAQPLILQKAMDGTVAPSK